MAKSSISSTAQVIDPRYITLTDFSVYNTEIPVTNALYRITLAAFNQYVDIPYEPGTILNVNSNLLKLTASGVSGLCDIPSGLYIINQSVCPNDKLFSEYYLFNIVPDLKKLAKLVCCHREDNDKMDALWDIKLMLETAKILAEDCSDTKNSVSLYNIASKKINSFDCNC